MSARSSFGEARLSRVPIVVGLGLLALGFGIPMLRHATLLDNPHAPHGILTLQMTYDARDAGVILSSWSREDLGHATTSLYWDTGFAIAYGGFLSALTRRCLRRDSRVALVTACLPILAAMADLAENTFHLMLIDTARNGLEGTIDVPVFAGFVFASTKWGLLAAWAVLLLSGLAVRIFRQSPRKSP